MKNRYGDEYSFEQVDSNTYKIVGNMKYCRYGGRKDQPQIDMSDLGFFDPSGGPFISHGYEISGRRVVKIAVNNTDVLFTVE